jgi:magnesium chelatase family protein
MKHMKVESAAALKALFKAVAGRLRQRKQTFVLVQGPVGSGKIMLARRLAMLVPSPTPTDHEAIVWLHHRLGTAAVLAKHGPFRAPHHTISRAGLTGTIDRGRMYPGELSLAHAGTLLFDEAEKYGRGTMEVVIHTLLDKEVRLTDRSGVEPTLVRVPAKPALVIFNASPCPCGQLPRPACHCTERQILTFTERLGRMLAPLPLDFSVGFVLNESARDALKSAERWGDT